MPFRKDQNQGRRGGELWPFLKKGETDIVIIPDPGSSHSVRSLTEYCSLPCKDSWRLLRGKSGDPLENRMAH